MILVSNQKQHQHQCSLPRPHNCSTVNWFLQWYILIRSHFPMHPIDSRWMGVVVAVNFFVSGVPRRLTMPPIGILQQSSQFHPNRR